MCVLSMPTWSGDSRATTRGRMLIERDRIEILSGVRMEEPSAALSASRFRTGTGLSGRSACRPIPCPRDRETRALTQPRPGHGDLAGALKHHTHDARDILERASAPRNRDAGCGGSLCKSLLAPFGIRLGSHVLAVGSVRVSERYERVPASQISGFDPRSPLPCLDLEAELA